MTAENRRSLWLAVAAGTLTLLFLADRLGWLPGGAAAPTEAPSSGARGRYMARAAEAAQEEALIERSAEWQRAAERAEREWEKAKSGLVRGQTAELCETRFREIVLGAMQDIRLVSPARINYVRDGAPSAGSIRALRLNVEFDAPTPRDAYAIIDRLENLPDARARIESLRIEGPGRIQVPRQVRVVLTLGAVALVGEGGA